MFKDLGIIVHDQGKMIDTIADHVDVAKVEVEEGTEAVHGALEQQKSAGNKLKMIVCLILLILIVIVGVAAIAVFVFAKG